MYTTTAIFNAEIPYKSLIFGVFMPKKEKIADILVSTILNSNGATERNRTVIICMASIGTNRCTTAASFNVRYYYSKDIFYCQLLFILVIE